MRSGKIPWLSLIAISFYWNNQVIKQGPIRGGKGFSCFIKWVVSWFFDLQLKKIAKNHFFFSLFHFWWAVPPKMAPDQSYGSSFCRRIFFHPRKSAFFNPDFAVLKGFQLHCINKQNQPSHKSLGHFLWDDFWPTPEMLKKQPLAANFGHEPEGQGGPIACLDGWARAGLSGIGFFFTTIFSCTLWRLSSRQHHTLLHMFDNFTNSHGCPQWQWFAVNKVIH